MECLLGQTFGDFEIVAVDDGSTDGSADMLADFAAQDARVRVLSGPHRGLVTALNSGLAACRGALVARMDADDRTDQERLELQLEFLKAQPEIGVVGTLVRGLGLADAPLRDGMVRYIAWQNDLVTPEAITRARFIESPLVHPTILARRSVLQDAGGYRQGDFPEDYDLWLRLLDQGVRMAKVPRVLHTWRDHGGRATRVDPRYAHERFRALKVAHLRRGPIGEGRPVVVWGAGKEGKLLLRAMREAGIEVPVVVEVDPRKMGNVIHGARVVAESDLDRVLAAQPGLVVLVAVGVPRARTLIGPALLRRGLVEGERFFFVC